MVLEGLLCASFPLAGRNFSFELLVPSLVLVLVQPYPQFAQLRPGESAQLFLNFLHSAQIGLRSDISSDSRANDILRW